MDNGILDSYISAVNRGDKRTQYEIAEEMIQNNREICITPEGEYFIKEVPNRDKKRLGDRNIGFKYSAGKPIGKNSRRVG